MGQGFRLSASSPGSRALAFVALHFCLAGLRAQERPLVGLSAPPPPRSELNASGLSSLSLGADRGSFGWSLRALSPRQGSSRSIDPSAPPALRAAFRLGPLSLGSLLLPRLLSALEDPLSRPALLSIGPQKAEGPSLDGRELPESARPGFQEEPGAALFLEGGLDRPNRGGRESISLCAGLIPEAGQRRNGLCASYLIETEACGLGLDLAALLVPAGRKTIDAEESWYLALVPELPPGLPVAAARAGLDMAWGPLSLSAGLRASNGRGSVLPWYGEAGISWEWAGISTEFALAFPLGADPARSPPLLAADGLPSGRREGAEAGILEERRWKGSWKGRQKGGPAWEASASYAGSTGRPLASGPDFLPRREELGIEAELARDSAGIDSSLRVAAARILDWKAEGGVDSEDRSEVRARIGFAAPRGGPSCELSASLGFSLRGRGGAERGEEAFRLLLSPGSLDPRAAELRREGGIALRFRGMEAKASLLSEGEGKQPVFRAKAGARLRAGGRAYLEIGPGEAVRLGWSGP